MGSTFGKVKRVWINFLDFSSESKLVVTFYISISIRELKQKADAKRIDAYAHNAGKYDGQYLLSTMYSDPDIDVDKIRLVVTGNKIIKISYDGINFYDSLLIFQQSLAMLPKSFGFSDKLMKGYAPLALLLESNKENRIFTEKNVFPAEKYFFTRFMTEKQYQDFKTWHTNESEKFATSNEIYDFDEQLKLYCLDDCRVLMIAIQLFRSMFKNVTRLDPLTRNFTLASIALEHFLVTKPDSINLGITPNRSYRPEALDEKHIEDYSKQKSCPEVAVMTIIGEENGTTNFCNIAFGLSEGDCCWQYNKKLGNFWPDGYCKTHNTVIEFNGCHWHNHDCQSASGNSIRKTGFSAKEEFYKSNNIQYHIFWECTYRDDEIWKHYISDGNVHDHFQNRIKAIKRARTKGYISIRDAMAGGRTMNFRHIVDCRNSNERIWLSDIVSMYPYVLSCEEFPLGHPTLIEAPQNFNKNWFGFIKCRVLPPRNLGLGVLPYRYKKRLIFPLCESCVVENVEIPRYTKCTHDDNSRAFDGTWTTEELRVALELGYSIQEIYFVLHYKKRSTGIFDRYIKVSKVIFLNLTINL